MQNFALKSLRWVTISYFYDSIIIAEDLKPSVISAVEENVRFLSNEELQAVLKDAPPDLEQEILRINEIARIHGIKTSLWGLVIFTILV